MIFIRQTVPDRNSRVLRQLFHDLLTEAAVLDSVEHPSEHPRGILDALLLSHLGACRPEVSRSHSHVVSRHLKRATCPCTVLLKQQGYVLSTPVIYRHTLFLLLLHLCRKIQQICNLLWCKVF